MVLITAVVLFGCLSITCVFGMADAKRSKVCSLGSSRHCLTLREYRRRHKSVRIEELQQLAFPAARCSQFDRSLRSICKNAFGKIVRSARTGPQVRGLQVLPAGNMKWEAGPTYLSPIAIDGAPNESDNPRCAETFLLGQLFQVDFLSTCERSSAPAILNLTRHPG